jgi:hypothetical protein
MKCTKCGTEVPLNERFCRNCGQEVVPLAQTIIATPPSLPPPRQNVTQQYDAGPETAHVWQTPTWQEPPAAEPVKQGRSPLLIFLVVASIVLALTSLGVLGYFLFEHSQQGEVARDSKGSPTPTPSPTASSTSSATPTPTPTSQPTTQPTATPTSQPTPKPTPKPVEQPLGSRLAYCNDTNVLVRSAPDLDARPITKITRGQKLWVVGTSSNYSTWNGISSNWTQVQLYNSTVRGWIFSPFVSYQ